MTAARKPSPQRAHARSRAGLVCVLAALASASPAAAADTTTQKLLGVKVPATAHATTTPAKTTSTPATTTPAASTPATTTPSAAGGAQPGTVAPGSATPGSVTPATTTPATTTPATTTPATAPTTSTPTSTTHAGSTTVVAVGKTKAKSKHLSAGVLALAILGALLALGAIAWAVARWLALEPRWSVSLMYSLREANYRASATWAEFSDWVRLGR
jgi:hypothetical protein